MEYKSNHVQRLFDVSAETVRNWSEEFGEYLSVTATPGTGRHRLFTHEDMEVFALIAELKTKGMTYADIHASLKAGQRGSLPETVAGQIEDYQLALQLDQTRQIIQRLEDERDSALQRLQSVNDENIRLQTRLDMIEEITEKRLGDSQSRLQTLNDELAQARKRIEELSREIGKSYHEGYMDGMKRPNSEDNTD